MSLILRDTKGEKITNTEFDNNLIYLRDKLGQSPVLQVNGTSSTITFDLNSGSNWWITNIDRSFTASFISFTQSDSSQQINLFLNQGATSYGVTNILVNNQSITYSNNPLWTGNSVDKLEIKLLRIGGSIKSSVSFFSNQPINSYSLIIGTQSVCVGQGAQLPITFKSLSSQRIEAISMWVQTPSSGYSSRGYTGSNLANISQASFISPGDNILRISWYSTTPYSTTGNFTIGTVSFTPNTQGTYNFTPYRLDPSPSDDYLEPVTEFNDTDKGELFIVNLVNGRVICNC